MSRDIEEFLRRAAERRQQQKQGGGQPPPAAQRRASQQPLVEEIEVVYQAEPIDQAFDSQSIDEHVKNHLDTNEIVQHAENLGERIQSVDDAVADRLTRKFDHEVGQLDDSPSFARASEVAGPKSSNIVEQLVEMLRRPESVKQAVILSEILNRPNFDQDRFE